MPDLVDLENSFRSDYGVESISDTNTHTGPYIGFMTTAAANINTMAGKNSSYGALTGVALPAWQKFDRVGLITSIKLTSGAILAFKATPNQAQS